MESSAYPPGHEPKDLPPPNQEAEKFLQEELKSARNGIACLLLLAILLGRTVQIFTRKPGTSGAFLVLASLLSIFPFSFFYLGSYERSEIADAIDPTYYIYAFGFFAFMEIAFAVLNSFRDTQPGLRVLGTGILQSRFPGWHPDIAGLVGDVTVALMLAGIFHVNDSPIQANWFAAMAGWICVVHLALFWRRLTIAQKIAYARSRVANYRAQTRSL